MDEGQEALEDKGAWMVNEPLRELGCLPVILIFLGLISLIVIFIFQTSYFS